MISQRTFQVLIAGAAFFVSGAARLHAQIDYRIQRSNEQTAGRALDANQQVGSGGFNQPVSGQYRFDYGLRANEIITGNVSGLGAFQGFSPIGANNAFRIGLPSAELARFRSTTVGLPEIQSGRLDFGPGSYYDPQQIISDAGVISRGMNSVGGSNLSSPYRRPPLPFEQNMSQQFVLPDSTDRRLQNNTTFTPSIRQRPIAPETNTDTTIPPISLPRYDLAAQSSLFGIPPIGGDRNRPSPTLPFNPLSGQPNSLLSARMRGGPNDQRIASDEPLGGTGIPRPPLGPGEIPKPQDLQFGSTPASGDLPRGPVGPNGEPLAPGSSNSGPVGGDQYSQMLAAVTAAQQSGIRHIGLFARTTESNVTNASDRSATGMAQSPNETDGAATQPPSPPTPSDSRRAIAELASAARWSRAELDQPIRTFTSAFRGQFNEYMAAAESALKLGKYYDAARYYELANAIDGDNPLPLLGRGHALAAAGDYISAVGSIERGIERFPQIAAFRIDLPSITGRPDAYDIRRADLEKRLEGADDYRFRFLLGYLELYSGLDERGLRDIERAARMAPNGSAIPTFYNLLTGKESTPEIPASR
ncbi:MAG: tetratricopeptide repeat protein [Phycisphaerae bacterium]|nr:tetratricopeptide repeat protein [Phycisphaerae bacterium]